MVTLADALARAQQAELDLVEVSPQANPPVCKIMDFGKYLFEQRKKAKNHTKRTQVKELKLRPVTDIGDYTVKIKRAIAFLQDGDKIRFVVRFKGRELSYQQHGHDILNRVAEDLQEYGLIEQTAKTEGRQMVMVIAPGKAKKTSSSNSGNNGNSGPNDKKESEATSTIVQPSAATTG